MVGATGAAPVWTTSTSLTGLPKLSSTAYAATTSAELSGVLSDENASGGYMTNPMTTAGDLIVGAASGASTGRLAAVAVGQVLTSAGTGTAPAWSAAPVFGTSIEAPFIILGSAATAADAGTIRLPNTGSILAEADAAGTDVNIVNVDASEVINIGSAGASSVVIGDNAAMVKQRNVKPTGNETWSGQTLYFAQCAASMTFGSTAYIQSTGKPGLADADAAATMPAIGLVVVASVNADDPCTILTHGVITDTDWDWTPGATLYVSETAGGVENTIGNITDTNDVVQVIGIALHANSILVMPSLTTVVLE